MATGGARCFQLRLEPWGEGGLAAAVKKPMKATSPRFDEKENEMNGMNKPLS